MPGVLLRFAGQHAMIVNLSQTREELGQRNRRLVLRQVLFRGPISRSAIASRIGLTQATVSRITRELIDAGLIEEGEAIADRRPGRRFVGLRVKPTGCFIAGVSINVFRQDVVVADLTNAPIASRRLRFESLDDARSVLGETAGALSALIDDTGLDRERLIGCGIVVTGSVDPARCRLRSAPALGWNDVNLRESIASRLKVPVFADSIPNAKNLTAHGFGSARGVDDVALLNVSLAVGCSLMLDGRLLRGPQFNAGLIESFAIPDETTGELRPLDHIAGGLAVVGEVEGRSFANGGPATSRLVGIMRNAAAGDAPSRAALNRAGRALAFAITSIHAILHPEVVLLCGPLIDSESYCSGVRRRIVELAGADFLNKRLRFSHLSNQEAACSLAIFRALVEDDVSAPPAAARGIAS